MTPRPLPVPSPLTQAYWDATRRHQLQAQRCGACETHVFVPRYVCPHCDASALTWVELSGRGTVHTFTIARRATHPAFADRVPYAIAIVELVEGLRMTSNIVGCRPDDVRIGMAVQVAFEDIPGMELALPVFRPADGLAG